MTNPLKQRREQLGKTQQEMADLLGVSKMRVSQYEKGQSANADKLLLFKEVYKFTVEELMMYLEYISKKGEK
jgi:transcriptional regulator with XRE-family HTH domain